MKYKIQDREAGNVIAFNLTKEEAEELVSEFEEQDEEDGIYVPNFYEIVQQN